MLLCLNILLNKEETCDSRSVHLVKHMPTHDISSLSRDVVLRQRQEYKLRVYCYGLSMGGSTGFIIELTVCSGRELTIHSIT